jgi:N-methylhydantoinase B
MTASETHAPHVDPTTFEIVRHKLLQVIEEAIIALKNVSGSPVTNEGHDLMVSLYRADGSLTAGGVGFLHHLTSAAQAVKHVIAEFGDDPGIYEDDAYFFNDSYHGALHPPDVYIISPIYYEGRLRGFVANFVHVTDIGGLNPGGFSPDAKDNYQEGFQSQGLKIVEGGRIRRDVMGTILNVVREPQMVALDIKSQLAANHVAKERMKELFRKYGVSTVEWVSESLISQSEDLVRERLRELPDGTWRAREYVDILGEVYRVELAATKQDDTLVFDFTGSSPEAPVGINCCYWATWGGIFAPIFPMLAWDVMWNDGVTRAFRLEAPEGTVVNCRRPAPISIATVGTIQIVNNLSTLVLSKIMGASPKYRSRATGVWHGSHAAVQVYGKARSGEYFVAALTDSFAGSGGARPSSDGIDLGGEIANVVSRWANAETHELNAPLLYLYRQVVADSGGPGKYRGGVCHEYAFTPHGSEDDGIGVVLFGKGTMAPMSLGVFGGGPGCNVGYRTFRSGNVLDLPNGLGSTAGRSEEDISWGTVRLAPGDIQYIRFMGGGGYGDPLDRDPQAVAADVAAGLVSREVARNVYGVELGGNGGSPDLDRTSLRRWELRGERLGRPVDPGRVHRSDIEPTGYPIGEYLQETLDGATQCTWCGLEVAPSGVRWKERAVLRRSPVARAGPHRTGNGPFAIIEAFCPGCATALDVDVVWGDDPPLYDVPRRRAAGEG